MQNLAVSHIIILKDKDKTHEIAQCTLKDDKLFVRFKNSSKTFSYKKPHFKLFAKATTSSVFAYFKTLAHTIGIKSDTSTQSLPLLAKEYDKITYISEDCVLFNYLNPPKTITKAQIAQSDVYQMWAYASKYALESTLQNTKSKLDSKEIKSQKAPEITELESSTDCKKIEANKPK
ncbi:hypothetical protein [uncultured Helicobacter sp.]|uniref:hypothetical protein n=1 Tax=uncultured Helicobacter sp. TaxID=175537 RepID=UPI00374F7E58